MTTSISNECLNLFVRLYRHRPHQHHTPKENFVTEAFAILLTSDKALLLEFFLNCLNKTIPDDVAIATQVRFKESIFDIVFTNNRNFYYIVECKMDAFFVKEKSIEPRSQLEKYERDLRSMEFEQKGIIVISLRNPPAKSYTDIEYFPLRWVDVRDSLNSQSSSNIFTESLRKQFIELLNFLKVDRTLKNNKLLWRCEICGLETRGQGIYSHKEKHCKQYSFLFDEKNFRIKQEFLRKLEPQQMEIDELVDLVRGFNKIEMKKFSECERVILALENSTLPRDFWLYFASKISFCFSNKAYYKFLDKLRVLLKDVDLLIEPSYIMRTYENLLLHKDKFVIKGSILDRQAS